MTSQPVFAGGDEDRMSATSVFGPSRHIAVPRDLGRFRGEADIERQAQRAASVDNDP